MLNKILSSFGVQGIHIDTILKTSSLQPGQLLTGEIHFKGATTNKSINGLSLQLMTKVEVESEDHEYTQNLCIAHWNISAAFELIAHQAHIIPFQIQLPYETPITALKCARNRSQVWLHTHLDVDWGIDAQDQDGLQIKPTFIMQNFLNAMQHCGFILAHADVEKGQLNGQGFRSTIGCYQELEFVPQGMFNSINEVEVSFVAQEHHTHVLIEIDRKFRGDGFRSMTIPHDAHGSTNQIMLEIKRQLGI